VLVNHDHLVSEERVEPFAYAGLLSADFLVAARRDRRADTAA
jgi:hypothetical protein